VYTRVGGIGVRRLTRGLATLPQGASRSL